MDDVLYQNISNLLHSIDELSELLVADQIFFNSKALSDIQGNLVKKNGLLDRLNDQLLHLQNSIPPSPDGKSQTLSQYLNKLDKMQARPINDLLKKLQMKLTSSYKALFINNDLVMSNMSFMNDVVSKLSKLVQHDIDIYEKPNRK